MYFLTNSIVAFNVTHLHNPEIQNALVSKILLSYKTVNKFKSIPPDMPDEEL